MKYWTGIGSRETPGLILAVMSDIARHLGSRGYILRSGAADGADSAFEDGADEVAKDPDGEAVSSHMTGEYLGHWWRHKEIYLPKRGFNNHASVHYDQCLAAVDMAKEIHPNWAACSDFSRRAHARNVHQVLGQLLNQPSEFVVCWTKGGKAVDGTRTAIKVAEQNGIEVINLAMVRFPYERFE